MQDQRCWNKVEIRQPAGKIKKENALNVLNSLNALKKCKIKDVGTKWKSANRRER
jgi:hypothetical protein